MLLRYVSQGGVVEMGGGNHVFSNISLINGFGLPAPDYEEITYAGQNGTTTTGKVDLPRTITITGDFYGNQKETLKLMKAFYYPGELYCSEGTIKRKIACKCTNLSDIEKRNNCGINGFTVQFQADSPYFSDFYDTDVSLASYINHVTDSFTLPCVFTELKIQGEAYNSGDLRCYPKIKLTTAYEPNANLDRNVLSVTNHTTGASVSLEYVMQKDEEIIINLLTRKINSSINGNITNNITDDTNLEKFYLETGHNLLTFSTDDKKQPVTVIVTYNNLYVAGI